MRQLSFFTSFFCVVLIFALFPLQAEKVDAGKAGSLAQRYVQSKRGLPEGDLVRLKHTATQKLKMNLTATVRDAVQTHAQDTVFYFVFNVNETAGGGFVIVAGDDVVTPVLGYSDSGSYDENNLPPNFVYWMNFLQDEIRWAITQKLPQSQTIQQQWDDYLNGNIIPTAVTPLLPTTWNQGAPYWDLCPMYNNNRSVSGCVATAMAQIMNYHRHPARGSGQSTAYTTRTHRINMPSVSFAVNYDWGNMLNSYTETATTQQQSAVATLMYHCGLSVQMDYSPDGSGAYSEDVPAALKNYFGYDKSCTYVAKTILTTTASWETRIKEQLDAGLPVYYSGHGPDGGHAFVCDGYSDDGEFHFNWGWGGYADGWFKTTALNTDIGTFNSSQGIVINIKPAVNVPVTGVSLNKSSTTINTGSTEQLTATVAPTNATNKSVTWSSSNTGVATVSNNGLVTGVSAGTSTITVTTVDGAKQATCLITVVRPGLSNNANLSALSVNTGILSPAFNANTVSYTANVIYGETSITVSATPADANATVTGTGSHSLNVGSNTINVVVTAQDETTQKTYTIIVVRLKNNANLSALSVNQGSLSPAFNANTVSYTVNVANSVKDISVSATPEDADATVAGTGNHSLNAGNNTILVVVTAHDGTTQKIYTITVIRAILSNNANLGSLAVNSGTLVPSFSPDITDYTVNVENGVSIITITAEPEEDEAVISGNGQCSLKMGDNIIKIEVTAPSGTITMVYTVVVVREQLTKVEDNQNAPLKAYPNPAQDHITISGLQGNGFLTVIDMAGRQLIRHQIASTQETISVNHLPQGFYMVEAVEGNNKRMIKIIIE